MTPVSHPAGTSRRLLAYLVIPLTLCAAAYVCVLDAPFLWDDEPGILLNPLVRDIGSLFRHAEIKAMLGPGRPVTDLTFALNRATGGFTPWHFHATNLLLHLGVVVLVLVFTRRVAELAGAPRAGAIALGTAGVFALHPIQTAAVSYVVQRSEVLASGLYVAVLLLLLSAEDRVHTWRGKCAWAGAVLAYLLALGSKTIAVTAPAAYLLVVAAVERTAASRAAPPRWRRRAAMVSPFFAVAVACAIAVLGAIRGQLEAGFGIPGLRPSEYLLTQLRVVVVYLRLLVLPVGQNADWDFAVSQSLTEPAALVSGVFLAAVATLGVALLRWGRTHPGEASGAARLAGLGILWFFLVLSVTSTVIPIADLAFEHRLYLASWGVFLAAAVGVERLTARFALAPLTVRAIVASAWCALAVATWARNAVWQAPEAFWRDAAAKSPDKARPYFSLGDVLLSQARFDEALPVYAEGLERTSLGDPYHEAVFLGGMGRAQAGAGRLEEASASLRAALEREPDSPRRLDDLGTVLMNLGDLAGAEKCVLRSLELEAGNSYSWNRLAELRITQGDHDAALQAIWRAAALDSNLGIVSVNAGRALAAKGRAAEACVAWREALTQRLDAALRQQVIGVVGVRCQFR